MAKAKKTQKQADEERAREIMGKVPKLQLALTLIRLKRTALKWRERALAAETAAPRRRP